MKSWIDISAAALRNNLAAIQHAAGANAEVLCVIKADAYGHGAALCAPVLVQAGARWLGVGDLEEGIRVREALVTAGLQDHGTRILVMCGFEPSDAPGLLQHQLTPVVWTAAHVAVLDAAAAQRQQRVPVHLELDTGMGRQGAAPGPALDAVLQALQTARFVRLEGVFSHLSSSEVAHSVATTRQLGRLGPALEQVLGQQLMPEYLHLANTSAIDEHSTLEWVRNFASADMRATPLVRPGLGLYGYALPVEGDPFAQPHLAPELQPVATWRTHIVSLSTLQVGDTVGYGATFLAPQTMRLALLPLGYADGFRREASSGLGDGWVVIAGQRAPVVGRVSMNLTAVDVSQHEPSPVVGEEVLLLGPGVTANDHARWCQTISYEILCGMRGHRRLT